MILPARNFKTGRAKLPFPFFLRAWIFPLPLVLILSLCYSVSMAPGFTWAHFSADAGDLISAAATGGVPHPSGYPLYVILAQVFQALPVGDLAFRTNLLSAVCTVATAVLLYQYLSDCLQCSPWTPVVSFLAALAYGLAPFVWGQALVTEVYALHALLMMLCIHSLSMSRSKISEWMCGFVFGLAAANHLTAILIFPLLLLGSEENSLASRAVLRKRFLGLIGGLSIYLTLPMRAFLHPPINWGDASAPGGFFWLISGRLYHQYSLGLSPADLLQRFRGFAGLLLDQFTWIGIVLGIYGLLLLSSRRRVISILWMAAVFLCFALFYGSSDSLVNLLPVWLAFTIFLAFGLQDILEFLSERHKLQGFIVGFVFIALMIRIPLQFASVDASRDFRARDFINQAIQVIPQDALVFVEGDEKVFSLWYIQFALEKRLDMVIVSEGLLPYPWYAENLEYAYPNLWVPKKEELQSSDLSYANPGRTICYISYEEPIVCLKDNP